MAEPAYDDADPSAAPAPPTPDELLALIIDSIEQMPEEARRQVNEAVGTIIGSLTTLANEQVQKKSQIETRWLEDVRQYHGRYSPETETKFNETQSRVFANVTRPKTHGWAARVSDILFPTDDKNYAITPTPVPELLSKMQGGSFEARRLVKRANLTQQIAAATPDQAQAQAKQDEARQYATQAAPFAQQAMEAKAVLDEAKSKAEAMESEIEDQLIEAKFGIKCRMSVLDMMKLGTAIVKGPLTKSNVRGSWSRDDESGPNVYRLNHVADPRPEWQRVDPWNWFPDMGARTIDEAEFFFERHLLTKRDMRKLAKKPGFSKAAIREILRDGPKDPVPNYLTGLRGITGSQNISVENRYTVWEYHGSLEGKDIDALARLLLPPGDAAEVIMGLGDDPLKEQPIVLWFCGDKALKIGPHPLDSCDPIYSACPFVEDDTSIFGFGVPFLARNAQAIINGAWRMMMDNGDSSSGPQVVVNQNIIDPAVPGSWDITGFKLWLYKQGKTLPPGSPEPFQVFQTNSNLQYLLQVVKLAMEFLDQEVSLPLIAQGEQGSHIETAEGRGMLMNAANVIFRAVVRNWDDKITVPCLTRAYDWNMQHSSKEHIKGDMQVDARGSSVLLVRELQTTNLTNFLKIFGESPVYGPFVKHLDGLRELAKVQMVRPDTVIKSNEDVEAEAQERAANPPPPTGDELKFKAAELDANTRVEIAGLNRETALITLATKGNMDLQKLFAQMEDRDKDRKTKERLGAVDAALTMRQMAIKATEPHPNISTTGTTQ